MDIKIISKDVVEITEIKTTKQEFKITDIERELAGLIKNKETLEEIHTKEIDEATKKIALKQSLINNINQLSYEK